MKFLLLTLCLSGSVFAQQLIGQTVKLSNLDESNFPAASLLYRGGLLYGTDAGVMYVSNGSAWEPIRSNAVEVTIAVNASGYFSATVTGQTWVTPTSKILCEPFATSEDGLTPEVIAISGVRATAAQRVAATSFDVLVFNPNGLVGTVRFHCTGV